MLPVSLHLVYVFVCIYVLCIILVVDVLSDIHLPPRICKRGRPKGHHLTTIGLPRRNKRCAKGPVVYVKMTSSAKCKGNCVAGECRIVNLRHAITYDMPYLLDGVCIHGMLCLADVQCCWHDLESMMMPVNLPLSVELLHNWQTYRQTCSKLAGLYLTTTWISTLPGICYRGVRHAYFPPQSVLLTTLFRQRTTVSPDFTPESQYGQFADEVRNVCLRRHDQQYIYQSRVGQ